MPSILLINENKIVSRLLQLSSEKNGYNLEEVTALDSSGDSYDVIFIDSDKYSDALIGQIESKLNYEQLGYIGSKQETVPEGFDLVIEKPFLPTDFVDMIKEQVIAKKSTDTVVDTDSAEAIESFDLDDETDMLLELDDDKLDLDDLDDINDGVEELLVNDEVLEDDISLGDDISIEDLDMEDDVDLSLDPALMMTTGVATSMALEENTPEDLADIVNDIDLMEEDTDIETLEEPMELETEDENLEMPVELEIDNVEDTLDLDELTLEDEEAEERDDTLALAGAAAAVASAGVVASEALELDDEVEALDDIADEISSMDDIDALNEADMQDALNEEVVEEVVEEIVSEEIVSDGEETLVESNDVEQWIRDAVQKAITPAMIKEALDGMDINVTLSFNSKKEDSDIS